METLSDSIPRSFLWAHFATDTSRLKTGDIAVGAGLGAAHQHAIIQPDDHLPPTEAGGGEIGPDIVAQPLELPGHLHGKPGLHSDSIVPHPLPARGIESLLGVQVEVHVVHDHLDVTLGLHIAPHDSEGAYRPAVLEKEAGNDGVIAPLAGLEGIGVLGVE